MRLKRLIAILPLLALSPPAPPNTDELYRADQKEWRAVLLVRNDQVVRKSYAPGYSDANRFISWSMAKSVTAVLVGELVVDGKLKLDDAALFAEWRTPGDPRLAITLRQMLHMESGLSHTEVGKIVQNSDTNQALFVQGTQSMAAYALAKPLEAAPGTKYEYSSLTSLLLAELITRTLTDSRDPRVRANAYKAFAEERLFKPAGITSAVMDFDAAGTQVGGSIIYMTLDDWGRFGQVLLDGGGVIAPDWLTFMRTPSPTNPRYGGHIWLNAAAQGEPVLFPGQGPPGVFAAIGHLGQYVVVSPQQKLVLVRLGKTQDDELQAVRQALGEVVASAP